MSLSRCTKEKISGKTIRRNIEIDSELINCQRVIEICKLKAYFPRGLIVGHLMLVVGLHLEPLAGPHHLQGQTQ